MSNGQSQLLPLATDRLGRFQPFVTVNNRPKADI
jgi:hypothetical protein